MDEQAVIEVTKRIKALEKKYVGILTAIAIDGGDHEINHLKADDVLCELLKELGLGEVAEAFDDIEKWYA